jgi:hypothetical protein
MERNATCKAIEPQATGVPDDFVDPNHPHFPHDPEAALPERPYKFVPFMSKKPTQIAMVVIFVLLSYIATALVGGKVGMIMTKRPAANETVYSTTTVFATTVISYTLKLNTETITSTVTVESPKPRATCVLVGDKNYMANADECNKDCNNFISDNKTAACKFDFALSLRCEVCDIVGKTVEAPGSSKNLFPVYSAFSWTPSPPSSTPALPATSPPPPTPAPKKGISECFWTGRWSTKNECDTKCEEMDDKSTDEKPVCNEERGFYRCRICKAV